MQVAAIRHHRRVEVVPGEAASRLLLVEVVPGEVANHPLGEVVPEEAASYHLGQKVAGEVEEEPWGAAAA